MSEQFKEYDSSGQEYQRAFRIFLDHTDQKQRAGQFLQRLVRRLSQRHVFIDVGAGDGTLTALLSSSFERTIAIEPNRELCTELKRRAPSAEILPCKIMDAVPSAQADLLLCSHVFYYIDQRQTKQNVDRLLSWLSPGGVLVIVEQAPDSDCRKMMKHFFQIKTSYDAWVVAKEFLQAYGNCFDIVLSPLPSMIRAPNLETAFTITEFLLNANPFPKRFLRSDVEQYVKTSFSDRQGGFCFSCDQVVYQVRRIDDEAAAS